MDLGTFSVTLAVKDIRASLSFYETLGFEMVGGNVNENWVVLDKDGVKIGLFQGMYDRNMLTFNPPNVRAIQLALKDQGVAFKHEADEFSDAPAHATLEDPDGNVIILDERQPRR